MPVGDWWLELASRDGRDRVLVEATIDNFRLELLRYLQWQSTGIGGDDIMNELGNWIIAAKEAITDKKTKALSVDLAVKVFREQIVPAIEAENQRTASERKFATQIGEALHQAFDDFEKNEGPRDYIIFDALSKLGYKLSQRPQKLDAVLAYIARDDSETFSTALVSERGKKHFIFRLKDADGNSTGQIVRGEMTGNDGDKKEREARYTAGMQEIFCGNKPLFRFYAAETKPRNENTAIAWCKKNKINPRVDAGKFSVVDGKIVKNAGKSAPVIEADEDDASEPETDSEDQSEEASAPEDPTTWQQVAAASKEQSKPPSRKNVAATAHR